MHLVSLLLQIAAILVAVRLFGRVMRALGQPSVIAEIVAGIALGPSLLGAVWPAGMTWLFPAESLPQLGTTAQLGLVFFMFFVGLEFDPKLLEGRGRASFAISNAGIIVPLLLSLAVAPFLHADFAPGGVPLMSFALFLGVAMSVTAFPVLARILTESRLVKTPIGALALAAAAADDVSAWCMLAVVAGIAGSGSLTIALRTVALAVAYALLVWFAVRPALNRIGPRAGSEVSTELVGLAMIAVVLSAAITEWIGIHALFGGFLIGAAMPRASGLSKVLAEKLEDFVTIVLLPLFFAYSGLRTRIGLLDTAEDWWTCLLLIAIASLGKFGGTSVVAKWTGFSWREAGAIGVLMNTRGLMEIVVLNVGLDLGVISERLFAMMVLMALVTTYVTTPILRRLYTPEAAAQRPVEGVPAGVVVCLSDPALAGPLVQLARTLKKKQKGTVWAVHLHPVDRPRYYLREPGLEHEPLSAFARVAAETGVRYEPISFATGEPAEDLVRIATEKRPQILILGTHHTSLGGESLGGVVGEVLDGAPCPVGVLVDHGLRDLHRFAVAAGSAGNAAVESWAARIEAGGAERVADGGDADLVLAAYVPGGSLPKAGGPSWLLLRDP